MFIRLRHLFVALLFTILPASIVAQGFWAWNNRTHPELEWQVLSTEHYNVYYHEGLEGIAVKGATIAEQIHKTLLDQIGVEDIGKIDIIFSAEDEIMNGYAMPTNQTFIWVHQNDVAGWFGGSEKWLRLVVAHELQHIVLMNALKDWLGVWNLLSVPGWFIEGSAEYYTEVWRVGRSDSRMKVHTYQNIMNKLDPHDMGYAKLLFMGAKFGDSTITEIIHYRDWVKIGGKKWFTLPYSFKKAFKKVTGVKLKDFDEEWRRAMNTYYYTYRGQKESVDEVGEAVTVKKMAVLRSLSFAPDSSVIAVVGRAARSMYDWSIYTVTTDTNHTRTELHFGIFGSAPSWSPDGRYLTVAEYRRGRYGSIEWDIRIIEPGRKKVRWLTEEARATDPVWSPDGRYILYVAHPGETTNLYLTDPQGENHTRISSFGGDVQIQDPQWSPDGKRIVFAVQGEDGLMDIGLINNDGTGYRKLTEDPPEDLAPLWSADGKWIVFTSFRNSTPNLFRVAVDGGGIVQMTDVADGLYTAQIMPGSGAVIATTLSDVDSVRIRRLPMERSVENSPLAIRNRYSDWRKRGPEIGLPAIDYTQIPSHEKPRPYRSWGTWRPMARLVIPGTTDIGAFGYWTDGLGKNLLFLFGDIYYSLDDGAAAISWLNARHRAFISLSGYYNTRLRVRSYGEDILLEGVDGVETGLIYPFNFGHRLSSNHTIGLYFRGFQRRLFNEPVSESLGVPSAPREGGISLRYVWKTQRPHKAMQFLPNNGTGVQLRFDQYSKDIYGDFDYSKTELDLFTHIRLFSSPLVVFGRAVWSGLGGDPPNQDRLGLLTESTLYQNPGSLFALMGEYVESPELHSLRGLSESRLGRQVVSGTLEFRIPLLETPVVKVLGLGLGNLSAAVFTDFGQVFEPDDPREGDLITTTGAEIKTDIVVGELSLITLAYGVAGMAEEWQEETIMPYLRLGLIAPF